MRRAYSLESYDRVQACDLCETYIYNTHKDKWDNGWRPSKHQARRYLAKRGCLVLDTQEIENKESDEQD